MFAYKADLRSIARVLHDNLLDAANPSFREYMGGRLEIEWHDIDVAFRNGSLPGFVRCKRKVRREANDYYCQNKQCNIFHNKPSGKTTGNLIAQDGRTGSTHDTCIIDVSIIGDNRSVRADVLTSSGVYVNKKFFPQRSSWDEIWIFRGALWIPGWVRTTDKDRMACKMRGGDLTLNQ
jgi:hypothetical protein